MVRARVSSTLLQAGGLAVAVLCGSACMTHAALLNGVASGDVTQTSAVLWARSTVPGAVTFEYSTDPTFAIKSIATADVSDVAVPAKVQISGLDPAMRYYYRVTDAEAAQADGQFRTAAPLGTTLGLHFGASGDWHHAPPFPSLKNVAGKELDFFIKLGDGIYADYHTPALPPGQNYSRTLADFRAKQGEITLDRFGANFMVPLEASTSLLATIDDHEIVDNFAGGATPGESPDIGDVYLGEPPLFTGAVPYVNKTQVYQDAMQAFQEYHPIRSETWSGSGDARMDGTTKLYRKVDYGSDVAVFVLDTRSFRDAQRPAVANPLDPAQVGAALALSFDINPATGQPLPQRTLLGRAQMETLKSDLLQAQQDGVTWKFVVVPEPIQNFGVVMAEDRFEGYAAERTELLKFIRDTSIPNVVFLAADHHGTSVNNLLYQELLPLGPGGALVPVSTPTNAFEIMTGPAAFYESLLGPTLVDLALEIGVILPWQKQYYDGLPVQPDPADTPIPNDKDDFVEQLIDSEFDLVNGRIGLPIYDPIGLDKNLPAADGLIRAELLQGDYFAAHTFGWAEFDIDPVTQDLLVTVWGIDAYSEADLQADPSAIIGRQPWVVSQFLVHAVPEPGTLTLALLGLGGIGLLLIRRRAM